MSCGSRTCYCSALNVVDWTARSGSYISSVVFPETSDLSREGLDGTRMCLRLIKYIVLAQVSDLPTAFDLFTLLMPYYHKCLYLNITDTKLQII